MLCAHVTVRTGDEVNRAVVREVWGEPREYYVHFLGWKTKWDRWVGADQVIGGESGESGSVAAAPAPGRVATNRLRSKGQKVKVKEQPAEEFSTSSEVNSNDSDEVVYNVEKIVGRRQHGREMQYKVRWEGFGPSGDTWEPVAHLASCIGKVRKYIEGENAKKQKLEQRSHGHDGVLSKDERLAVQLQRGLAGMRVRPEEKAWVEAASASLSESHTASEAESETTHVHKRRRLHTRAETRRRRHASRWSSAEVLDSTDSEPEADSTDSEPEELPIMDDATDPGPTEQAAECATDNALSAKAASGKPAAQGDSLPLENSNVAASAQKRCSSCGKAQAQSGIRCSCGATESADGTTGRRASPRLYQRAVNGAVLSKSDSSDDLQSVAHAGSRSLRSAALAGTVAEKERAAKQQQSRSQKTNSTRGKKSQSTSSAAAADEEHAEEYYPQRIIGVAKDANGHRCYQVKWHYHTDISLEPIERVQTEPAFQDALDRYFATGVSIAAAQKTGSNAAKKTQVQAGNAGKNKRARAGNEGKRRPAQAGSAAKNKRAQAGNVGKKTQAQAAGKAGKKTPSVRAGPPRVHWSAQEDNELLRLLARDGPGDWDQKASEFNSRRKNDLQAPAATCTASSFVT